MKALELSGYVNEEGQLILEKPLEIINQRVKIIMLLSEEEIDEAEWEKAISSNSAFNFLNDDAEDIYSITDGQPFLDAE